MTTGNHVDTATIRRERGQPGVFGSAVRPVEALRDDGWRLCDLASRPFAVNHTRRPFDAGAYVAIAQDWEAGGNADEVAIRSSCLS